MIRKAFYIAGMIILLFSCMSTEKLAIPFVLMTGLFQHKLLKQ
jgi:hypothetical protein